MLDGAQKPKPKFIVAWDLDLTLVKGHFHNELTQMEVNPDDLTESQVMHLITQFGLKNPAAVRESFIHTINNGGAIAIASYSQYPKVLPIIFREMNIPEEIQSQICIQTGYPSDDNPVSPKRKQEHLKKIMLHFGMDIQDDRKKVILMDDGSDNTSKAKQKGFESILVPPRFDWNKAVQEEEPAYITQLNQKIEAILDPTQNNDDYLGLSFSREMIVSHRNVKKPEIASCPTPRKTNTVSRRKLK